MRQTRATKAELEQIAAYEDRIAAEYETRASRPECNADHYRRAAETRRQRAAEWRLLAKRRR